jgi:hypothetical protein
MTFAGTAFALTYLIGIGCSLVLAVAARRLRPDVTLVLGMLAVVATGIASGIALRDWWPRADGPNGDPAFAFAVWAPLMLLMSAALVASGRARAASWAYAVTFAVTLAISYRTAAGGESVALLLPAATVDVPASAIGLAASDAVRARSALASSLIAIDLAGRAPAGGKQLTGLELGSRDALSVTGWAVDEDTGTPCEAVGIVVDGRRIVRASYGAARLDVAQYFHDPARTNVGYTAQVPASWLGTGRHVAIVVCEGDGGRFRRSPSEIRFAVRAGQ